ncbi:MAG: AraC family transcriptional regulator [Flavobacteriales bacterium]|nr:AraC family transcriptional regulator [Flavobacteriales bacterium]
MPRMQVQMHIPASLAPLVHAIWEQRAEHPSDWTILPSGRVELIFNLGPRMEDLKGKRVGGAFNPTEQFCFLSGLHTRPLRMSFPRCHVMGVQMEPLAVKALFGIPCVEVRDWAVRGEDVMDDIAMIEDRLRGPGSFTMKAHWLEAHLHGILRSSPELDEAQRMRSAVDEMVRLCMAGEEVHPADFTGYSRMHTHRLFNAWTGLPPGEFLRLRRFINVMGHVHTGEDDLTAVAHQHGYFDQAHFNHHFQRFAGMSPGRYRRDRWLLPGQLLS